jgi:hypothetical protein
MQNAAHGNNVQIQAKTISPFIAMIKMKAWSCLSGDQTGRSFESISVTDETRTVNTASRKNTFSKIHM